MQELGVVVVGEALPEVAVEVVEAVAQGFALGARSSEAPLTAAGGGRATLLKEVGYGDGAGRQRRLVEEAVAAGHLGVGSYLGMAHVVARKE